MNVEDVDDWREQVVWQTLSEKRECCKQTYLHTSQYSFTELLVLLTTETVILRV